MPPRPSKLDAFKPVIDDILRADLDAPRKQRHTVKRIYDRLIGEHGMQDVSYAVVRAYVADRKPKICVEAGRGPVNVFFPQTHRPAAEAEVDFGEVAINLRGELVTCMLFAFRLFLGQGRPQGLCVGWVGGVPGRTRPRVHHARRCPDRQYPLRQPEGGGRPGPRLRPATHRNRPVDGAPFSLLGRSFVLPAGLAGRS